MNKNWTKAFDVVNKTERLIIGLMSGTSLDGLDIALCRISDAGRNTKAVVENFLTIPYTESLKSEVSQVFSKRQVDLQHVVLMNERIGSLHADMVLQALSSWKLRPEDIDVIASHGQTIYHAPAALHGIPGFPNATLQIGDADHIAVRTGIITISDFRQKHIAVGGEGAPLAAYGDYLLFSKPGTERIMLNIGGIANFTYLPASPNTEVISTDVGPGNTLMDQFVRKHYGRAYDRNGEIASRGTINTALLKQLLSLPFFGFKMPKTTGPELFNLELLDAALACSNAGTISPEDILATLSAFTAEAAAGAITTCLSAQKVEAPGNLQAEVYLSGGGMHNSLLVDQLKAKLRFCNFFSTAELGVNPDAKEALLFAVLANEALAGSGFSGLTGAPAVNMGKISFPG